MKYDKSNILLLKLKHLMGVSATQIQGLKFTPEMVLADYEQKYTIFHTFPHDKATLTKSGFTCSLWGSLQIITSSSI